MTMTQNEFMTSRELADLLRVPVETTYQWRLRHVGPPGIRVGRHVRYRRSDVERWLAERSDEEVSR